MTGTGDFQHPRFARQYPRVAAVADRRGGARHRRRALAGLSGRVVEVGAGHGANFAHYPAAVSEVLAVEPDDTLRAHARAAAASAPVPVTVVAGHADALPAADASCDGAVASLVLCTVPDPDHALREIHRVLRAGGQLRFYEHVRSANPVLARIEDLLTPLWRRLAGGCHPNRATTDAVAANGFALDHVDRFGFRPVPAAPPLAHVLGHAHKR